LNQVPEYTAILEAAERGYSKGGYRAAVSNAIEEQLKQRARGSYVDPSGIAYNYAQLGNKEQTLRWLETAVTERSRGLDTIKIVPELDQFRADPRYRAVLRRMGLPE